MPKLHLSCPNDGKVLARLTSESGATLAVGSSEASVLAAIGALVLAHPQMFSLSEIHGLPRDQWRATSRPTPQ